MAEEGSAIVDAAALGRFRRQERARREAIKKEAAISRISFNFVAVGTGPQLDKLWIGILNLRPEEESEKLKEILAVGLSEIDPAKLSQKADGDFRVDPKDAESGIIPGVLEKALGRQVNRLAKELSESSDPDQAERLLSDAVLRCEVSADKWPFEDAALRIAGINFWDRDKNPDKVNQVLLHEVLREKE